MTTAAVPLALSRGVTGVVSLSRYRRIDIADGGARVTVGLPFVSGLWGCALLLPRPNVADSNTPL